MTALLTADEAARLRPGEQLVIVRPGDRWTCSCGQTVRTHPCPGNGGRMVTRLVDEFVAPQDWVALTGPCPTCVNESGWVPDPDGMSPFGGTVGYKKRCPDCRDDRRIEPLYTECPRCDGSGWLDRQRNDGGCGCNAGRVLVGRGSIELHPDDNGHDWGIVIDCVEVA